MVTVGTSFALDAATVAAALAAEAVPLAAPDTDGVVTDGIPGMDGMDGLATDLLDTDGILKDGLLTVGMLGKSGTAL